MLLRYISLPWQMNRSKLLPHTFSKVSFKYTTQMKFSRNMENRKNRNYTTNTISFSPCLKKSALIIFYMKAR